MRVRRLDRFGEALSFAEMMRDFSLRIVERVVESVYETFIHLNY